MSRQLTDLDRAMWIGPPEQAEGWNTLRRVASTPPVTGDITSSTVIGSSHHELVHSNHVNVEHSSPASIMKSRDTETEQNVC